MLGFGYSSRDQRGNAIGEPRSQTPAYIVSLGLQVARLVDQPSIARRRGRYEW